GNQRADPQRWARDLLKDPDIVFIHRTTVFWCGLSLIVPFVIGGWSGLLWGGFVRIFLAHHVTWSVNSVCHIYGSRPFNTKDRSTNHWLVGLLGFGEGGHNTHHASPRSARHGLYWWHFDSSWVVIRVLEKLGLAYNVYELDPEDLKVALRRRAASVKATVCSGLRGTRRSLYS
ncbi:MAG: acyl-CoA desaturase, partial [Dehalococcoidia bacterium]